jgi:hypothetical protein
VAGCQWKRYSLNSDHRQAFMKGTFPVLELMLNEFPVAFHKDLNALFVSPHDRPAQPRFSTQWAGQDHDRGIRAAIR